MYDKSKLKAQSSEPRVNGKLIDIGDLEALEGVKKFPVRIKCALLPWTTLEEALLGYKHVEIS
jgi:nitrogen fixation NifU-like protein